MRNLLFIFVCLLSFTAHGNQIQRVSCGEAYPFLSPITVKQVSPDRRNAIVFSGSHLALYSFVHGIIRQFPEATSMGWISNDLVVIRSIESGRSIYDLQSNQVWPAPFATPLMRWFDQTMRKLNRVLYVPEPADSRR